LPSDIRFLPVPAPDDEDARARPRGDAAGGPTAQRGGAAVLGKSGSEGRGSNLTAPVSFRKRGGLASG
jgi:hypothetical protein